jgi:hypothetical protein
MSKIEREEGRSKCGRVTLLIVGCTLSGRRTAAGHPGEDEKDERTTRPAEGSSVMEEENDIRKFPDGWNQSGNFRRNYFEVVEVAMACLREVQSATFV